MQINVFKLLQIFLFAPIEFTKDTQVGERLVKKGEVISLTPGIIHAIMSNYIAVEAIRPHLRQLHQISDAEARLIAGLAYGDATKVDFLSKVDRQGFGDEYTITIDIEKNYRVSINAFYDVAILEIIPAMGRIQPIFTFLAAKNTAQIDLFFIEKFFDKWGMIKVGLAFARAKWDENDYAK